MMESSTSCLMHEKTRDSLERQMDETDATTPGSSNDDADNTNLMQQHPEESPNAPESAPLVAAVSSKQQSPGPADEMPHNFLQQQQQEQHEARLFTIHVLSFLTIFLAVDVVLLLTYVFWSQHPSSSQLEYTRIHSSSPSLQQQQYPTSNSNNTMTSLSSLSPLPWKPLPPSDQILTKISFGSCISPQLPQPHWDTIVTGYDPDLLLLLGDNVYGDCENDTHCENLIDAYHLLSNHPSVQGAAPRLSVLATIDNHDYGRNVADGENPHKDFAVQAFRTVFALDNDEHTVEDGVYQAHRWGPPGKCVQIILLDTRYARTPLTPGAQRGTWKPSQKPHQQMLSERQWEWLETQLQQPADLRLIVSSIQVLNDATVFDGWRQLPMERQRLYKLLDQYNNDSQNAIFLLSGDRHVGGFYETDSLREITSSSFTHSLPLSLCSNPELCEEDDPRRVGSFVRENHWGAMNIDWEKGQLTISLRRSDASYGAVYSTRDDDGIGDAGNVLRSHTYDFV